MLGFHVSKNKRSLRSALIEDMGVLTAKLMDSGFKPCAQVFVAGPQSYRATVTAAEAESIHETGLPPIFIHGAYVDYIWNGKAAGRKNVHAELDIAARMGAEGVIVHLGAGAENPREAISDVLSAHGKIFLEVNAAVPDKSYGDPKKIAGIFEQIPADLVHRVGVCVDTAHLFSSGINLSTSEQAAQYIFDLHNELDHYSPTIMFHLNDSAGNFGTGKDIHDHITRGKIWSGYSAEIAKSLSLNHAELFAQSGAGFILKYMRETDTAAILERDDASHDINLIVSLATQGAFN